GVVDPLVSGHGPREDVVAEHLMVGEEVLAVTVVPAPVEVRVGIDEVEEKRDVDEGGQPPIEEDGRPGGIGRRRAARARSARRGRGGRGLQRLTGGGSRCHVYALRNLKLKRRISNCWLGFGVHSTNFWSP